jgi:hypothetical protein
LTSIVDKENEARLRDGDLPGRHTRNARPKGAFGKTNPGLGLVSILSAVSRRVSPVVWWAVLVLFFATIFIVRIHDEMVDFGVYQRASIRAWRAENLYRPDDGHYQYKYLPAFAFPMRPFAAMPELAARTIWYALTCGLLVLMVRRAAALLPNRRLSIGALTWFAILFMGKFYARELHLGQTNVLLGAILVLGLGAALTGRRVLAGVLIGVGIFVKPYAAILIPVLWLTSGIGSVAVAGAVGLAGLAAPALIYSWDGNIEQLQGWYRTVTDTVVPNLFVNENVSFAATWAKWIGAGPLATQLTWFTSAAALLLAGTFFLFRRGVATPAYLEFGVLLLLVALLSPQGWDYVLLLGTPAVLIAVDRWRDTPLPWKALTAVSIFLMSFTIFDVFGRTAYTAMMKVNVVTVAVVGLTICLLRIRTAKLA